MCGIAGAVWVPGSIPVESRHLDEMTDSLAHRGPDGRGIRRFKYDDGSGAALGHRRLSIIDLAGGTQPMCNEDETVWISFNGEIYNYQELRPKLQSLGHSFRTNSDSETIVHLYEQYGDDFVSHLRGMFAIAIWDERRRRLLLARDRLGQKPLVYSASRERILFASEIKAIHKVPDTSRKIRHPAIDEYLTYGYIPHPFTIYEDIHKLPPGHVASFEQGRMTTSCYWTPSLTPDSAVPVAKLQEELRSVIDDSVRLRMRSDVPLGAFLSGGIDSTVITGVMQGHATSPTNTFTIGFPVDGFDESEFAAVAANHLGTNHQVLEVKPDSLSLLDKLVWLFDEPFADSSAIPTYYVSQLTRQHVTVAMTGDGGDELFAGYDRYRTINRLQHFDRIPKLIRKTITGPVQQVIPDGSERSIRRRLKHRLHILRDPLEKRYANWMSGFPTAQRNEMYRPEWIRHFETESIPFLENLVAETNGMQPGIRAMRTDLRSYLPCDLLAKVDIMSMAHGLECRSPFLDHHVVETAAKFPFAALDRPGSVKPILTETFSQHLPEQLRNRPKMGFSVPLDRWFRNDLHSLARESLLADNAFCHEYLEPVAIESMLAEHASGRRRHGDRIWTLLFLELWGKQNSA